MYVCFKISITGIMWYSLRPAMLFCTDLDSEVKELTAQYESDARELSEDGKKDRLREIQDKFDKMKEYSEDKVQLTVQMYEMVSVHYNYYDPQTGILC